MKLYIKFNYFDFSNFPVMMMMMVMNDTDDDYDDDDEKRLALFPSGTIVRDPHHWKSPTRREHVLNLCRTLVQASLNEDVQ